MSASLYPTQEGLLKDILGSWPPYSFEKRCLEALNASTTYDFKSGLVNEHGQLVPDLSRGTWGITVQICFEYCKNIATPFNFSSFTNCLTNYLLPWLALTAQLPYETGNIWNNIMSFSMAVGSPALVTYSLTITILNKYEAKKIFDKIRDKAGQSGIADEFKAYESRINAAQYLLQEGQQVPLRASQEKGWFSSLIVVPKNAEWWDHMQDRLRDTKRGITASLVAQMMFACIAYLFTVIQAFQTSLGNPSTALQIASGSLWIWLIPVISGWITVGTQYRFSTVEAALNRSQIAYRALEPPIAPGQQHADGPTQQLGLVTQPCLSPLPHPREVQTNIGGLTVPEYERLTIPTWLTRCVHGDEQKSGPIFNYARLFTWRQLTHHMQHAFEKTLDNIKNKKRCEGILNSTPVPWDAELEKKNLSGDIRETARYCGLLIDQHYEPIEAYPKFKEVPADVWKRVVLASLAAVFVQWGTTGASVVIAYLTPTIGIGCRSASYLIYGGAATLVWVCLVISMLLSHAVMLRYQKEHQARPTVDFRTHGKPEAGNHYERDLTHELLCSAAVSLRILGKSGAALNGLWLVASSLFEFVGLYDNCWCMGNAPGSGAEGWIVLFQYPSDLRSIALGPWAGGLSLALGVCTLSYTYFLLSCWETGPERK